MPIKMQCPNCKVAATAPDGRAGRTVRCKRCGATFPIPPQAAAAPGLPTAIDRYQVRALLGSGTFGSVYRAFDPRLEREVALKVLRPEMTASTQAVERFGREAKAAAKLLHPHIVPVYDTGCVEGVYFIVSAFIQGRTLESAIPEEGMEPGRAATLAAQLASALGYAHQQGVLHRDVKPANAMLDERGSLQLMDFGLAGWTQEQSTRLTRLGAVMGTPAYMAPEQAGGDTARVGPASDLYSVGVVLYELLTGRLPFEGGHPAAMGYLIIHTEPPPPSEHRPGLDAGLEAICLKALEKDPAQRYDSGEEMAAALTRWAPPAPLAPPIAEPKAVVPRLSVWDKETVLPSSARSKNTPPADRQSSAGVRETGRPASGRKTVGPTTVPRASKRRRTSRRDRLDRRWVLWAGVSLVLLALLASAAVVVHLLSGGNQAVRGLMPSVAVIAPDAGTKPVAPPNPQPVDPPADKPDDKPPPPAETTTTGKVIGVDKDRLKFTADGGEKIVTVPAGATVRIDGKDGTLNEIRKDGAVTVTSQGEVVAKVEVINPPSSPPPPLPALSGKPPPGPNADILQEAAARRAVADQQGSLLVDDAVREANKKASVKPAEAIQDLMQTLEDVRNNPELSEAKRIELVERLKDALTTEAGETKPDAPLETAEKEETFDYLIGGETKHGTRRVLTVDLGGGVTMEFVRIPHGTFLMGSPDSDMEGFNWEKPRHEVEISTFYLAKYLVTKKQFGRFVEAKGYKTEAETDGKGGWGWDGKKAIQSPKYTWRDPSFAQSEDHPVVNVSWNDADAFCRWASGAAGRKVALPREAEWEYACRGGTQTRYFTGDAAESLEGSANVADRSAKKLFPGWTITDIDDGYVFTSPVGKFKANPFGLYDMSGNTWEWCVDYFDPKYYINSDKKDPDNTTKSGARVLRGGSWNGNAVFCRAAYRYEFAPSSRSYNYGLRVCFRLD